MIDGVEDRERRRREGSTTGKANDDSVTKDRHGNITVKLTFTVSTQVLELEPERFPIM
jgi:hypothetical protein